VTRVIEPALGDAANERHLATLEADANRAAGTGRLPLAATSAGFAMAAGLTLAEALATVLRAGAGFQIV
jgi:hypothetical protein